MLHLKLSGSLEISLNRVLDYMMIGVLRLNFTITIAHCLGHSPLIVLYHSILSNV